MADIQDAIHNLWSVFTELLNAVQKHDINEIVELIEKHAALQLAEEVKTMDPVNARIMSNVYNELFTSAKTIMTKLRNKEYHHA